MNVNAPACALTSGTMRSEPLRARGLDSGPDATREWDVQAGWTRTQGRRKTTHSRGIIVEESEPHLRALQIVSNTVALMGIRLDEAVRMASTYPARFLRMDSEIGSIAPGFLANLVRADSTLAVRETWIAGSRMTHVGPT